MPSLKKKTQPRRPGRPKLPEHEAKGKIVPVRFTAEEFERILEVADAYDLTVLQWIRTTLNGAICQ